MKRKIGKLIELLAVIIVSIIMTLLAIICFIAFFAGSEITALLIGVCAVIMIFVSIGAYIDLR